MYPRYPIPWKVVAGLALAVLFKHRRSFRKDAVNSVAGIQPALEVSGEENIPQTGCQVLLINHYHRPGFRSWWLTMPLSAVLPVEIHWVVAEAWTSRGWLYSHTITPCSRWLFLRIAEVYGFTSMPPMPPRPWEVERRAQAVREVLSYVKHTREPVIGLAPEGGDSSTGKLEHPPEGFGRFLLHLASRGLVLTPVGIFEERGRLNLRFGQPFCLELPGGLRAEEKDSLASQLVMERIARLLPPELRGEFAGLPAPQPQK